MEIKTIIDELIHKFNCILLSEVSPNPKDIDFHCKEDKIQDVLLFLKSEGFIVEKLSLEHYIFRKYFKVDILYVLDIFSNFNHITEFSYSYKLSKTGNIAIANDSSLYKIFKNYHRNFYDLISKEDYIALTLFFNKQSNFEYININNKYDLLDKKAKTNFPNKSIFIKVILKKLRVFLFSKKGLGLVFIGPDGSGKTFLIDTIKKNCNSKVLYFGNYFFYFQRFYNLLLKIPTPFNRFIYLFYQLEKFFRFLRYYIYILRGYIVLIDRYPGTNRNILHEGFKSKINKLSFKAAPRWRIKFINLYAPPKIVYKRKQELNIKQITNYQNKLKELIEKEDTFLFNTQETKEGLNYILKLIYNR